MSETHITLPQPGSAFYTDLTAFLIEETAKRYADQFSGMVVAGGIHGTVNALTNTPTPLTAYPGGYYVTETGAITYPAARTSWAIAHKDKTGDLGTFTRQAGTHYLVDRTSGSKPTLPADCIWLMEVVTDGSAITSVVDLRTMSAVVPSYTNAELLALQGVRGELALARGGLAGVDLLYYYAASNGWLQIPFNPMTTSGDLTYAGASGTPTRLPIGTADQLLATNSSSLAPEWRTLVVGDGLSVTYGSGTLTLSTTQSVPSGALSFYIGASAPTGWLVCDGSSLLLNSFTSLASPLVEKASIWGLPAAVGTFTVDTGTDICTCNGHGLSEGQYVQLGTSATLPSPLVINTIYKIKNATLNTFQLGFGLGNPTVDLTTTGTGTHSIYDHALLPNPGSRGLVVAGAGSGLTARSLGQSGGAETISLAAMPTHNHTITDTGHTHAQDGNTVLGVGGASGAAAGSTLSSGGTTGNAVTGITIQNTGSSAADGNMPPWMAFTLIIKT